MIIKLTSINCEISDDSYQKIIKNLKKISRLLPDIDDDLIVVRIVIKENTDQYHPRRVHPHTHKLYTDNRLELAYFEGSINFRLDKNRFFTRFKGQTIDESIGTGFQKIFKELKKYKSLHFSDESEYPKHTSIRKV